MENDTTSSREAAIRLPDMEKLVVSSSPHMHSGENIQRVMLLVILALLPAAAAGIYFFGLPALRVMVLCTVGCVAFEALFCKMRGHKNSIADLSAALTGILLAMNLSANSPWWICLLGAFIAMGLGKHIYGGLGFNPFNPALVARVALLIAFPGHLTSWVAPRGADLAGNPVLATTAADAVSTATPLYEIPSTLHEGGEVTYQYMNYFIGRMGGCIGETSALALLIGGLVLIALKLIRWQVPVAFIGTVAALTGIIHLIYPDTQPTPLFHMLAGGLFIGAFFMATDMVTSPMTRRGAIVFGVGCGVITTAIRAWGAYPEGVSFSILFMNALTPFIDRYSSRKPFGIARKKDKK